MLEYVISEYDYLFKIVRQALDQPIDQCRLAMIYDARYKLMQAEGMRPKLFDLVRDPDELIDHGACPEHAKVRANLRERLNAWYRQHHARTTISDAEITARENSDLRRGILIGFWDDADIEEANQLGCTGN